MTEDRRRDADPLLEIILLELKENSRSQNEFHKKFDETMNGNGHPGIKTRVDRLEQNEERRAWHMRAVWVGVLTAITKGFFGK